MPREIRKVAVLGAGVMGAGIAAHLANAGVESLLYDIVPNEGERSALARKGIETARAAGAAAFFVPELGRHVTLKLTTGDLRSIDKVGLLAYAKKHGVTLA